MAKLPLKPVRYLIFLRFVIKKASDDATILSKTFLTLFSLFIWQVLTPEF